MSTTLPILGMNDDSSAREAPPAAPDDALRRGRLYDSHGRVIRDLRLSVTDRCNYRCVYCMDPDYRYMPKRDLLSLEEYIAVARVSRSLGIEKLRLTGGEPTLYRELNELIDAVGQMGFDDIALTTNGSLLNRMPLYRWRGAGLHRITLSLDSLRDERVTRMTRTDTTPASVIEAIRIAHAAGFGPIKVNAVMMRGFNDDEPADFADFAREHGVQVRLIEFMPLDSSRAWKRGDVVGADEMLEKIRARHELVPLDQDKPDSTSLNFRFADGGPGGIGIIASVTRAFCGACSRMRITADGKVRSCLFSHVEWDLRPTLRRDGASDEDLRRFIIDSMWTKQAGHGINSSQFVQPQRTMSAIGG